MLLLFAAALLILMILPVGTVYSWKTEEKELILRIGIQLPLLKPLTVYKTRVTAASFQKSRNKERKIRWRIRPIVKHLRGHVRTLTFVLRFGTGNAASTACLAGKASGFAALLTAGKPERSITIEPVFQEKTFFAQGKCMIRTSLIHAIISIIASAEIQKSAKKQKRFSGRKT